MGGTRLFWRGLVAAGLVTWLLLALFPFLWMALMSLRLPVDAFAAPPRLFAPVTLENYRAVWFGDGFGRYALNTAIVTAATVAISMVVGCLAGYALSRHAGGLAIGLLVAALAFRALPHVVLLTAYRPVFYDWGIWSRYETLIVVLVAINQPFTIWLMRAFFLTVPRELDEAAMVDGCTRWQAFRRVILPVAGPGIGTAALFSFLLAYNDFLISSQLMSGSMQTMTAALGNYMGQAQSATRLMHGIAGAVLTTIPVVVLVFVFQRQFVAGLTAGAVKG